MAFIKSVRQLGIKASLLYLAPCILFCFFHCRFTSRFFSGAGCVKLSQVAQGLSEDHYPAARLWGFGRYVTGLDRMNRLIALISFFFFFLF